MARRLLTLVTAAALAAVAAAPAEAACSTAALAGKWTVTAGLFNCVVTVKSTGWFSAAKCEGAVLPASAASLVASTPVGDIPIGTMSIDVVGKLGGRFLLNNACRLTGTINFTSSSAVKTPLTVLGRMDANVNMFAASAVNRTTGSEALLMIGGYRN